MLEMTLIGFFTKINATSALWGSCTVVNESLMDEVISSDMDV
jgi:hypothetical protein